MGLQNARSKTFPVRGEFVLGPHNHFSGTFLRRAPAAGPPAWEWTACFLPWRQRDGLEPSTPGRRGDAALRFPQEQPRGLV